MESAGAQIFKQVVDASEIKQVSTPGTSENSDTKST